MPYKSEKQARLMRAVAHSPEFAKKVGISQSVGRKFEEHKAEGGTVKESEMKRVFAGKETPAEERKEKAAAKKAGMTYKAAERKFEGEKYCGGGKAKGYASGGMTETKRETSALVGKAPKRGIDPTIPAEVREMLMERQRQKDMAAGEAASRYAKGGKTKRYADGGETEAEVIGPQTTSDEGTFKEAFATARMRGDDTFTWKGKKYSTEMAPAKPKSPPAPTPKYEAKNVTKNAAYETPYDRMNRQNREESANKANDAFKPGPKLDARNQTTLGSFGRTKPYKTGGSVRGVGIAKRGFGCTGMK